MSSESFEDVIARAPGPAPAPAAYKTLFVLFVLFLVVVSDIFTDSVIAHIPGATAAGRGVTSKGSVMQGVFLVLFYSVALYFMRS